MLAGGKSLNVVDVIITGLLNFAQYNNCLDVSANVQFIISVSRLDPVQ